VNIIQVFNQFALCEKESLIILEAIEARTLLIMDVPQVILLIVSGISLVD